MGNCYYSSNGPDESTRYVDQETFSGKSKTGETFSLEAVVGPLRCKKRLFLRPLASESLFCDKDPHTFGKGYGNMVLEHWEESGFTLSEQPYIPSVCLQCIQGVVAVIIK